MRTSLLAILSVFLLVILYPLYAQADEITQMCQDKWGSNYRMVLYCIKNQRNAKGEISGYSGTIKNNCKKKWGSNYRMVLYCIKNQSAAKREIERNYNRSTRTNAIKSTPQSYIPPSDRTGYYTIVHENNASNIKKPEIQKVEKLISKYGKPIIMDLIREKRENRITLRVGSELRDFDGPPGKEYVTPETVLIDLANIGVSLKG
ncbi:MAG: hypothetical protein KAU60_17075, partial [Desulfobacterales bacterium]|nr:hypothetical protein [Desulfobacterales bacterium]